MIGRQFGLLTAIERLAADAKLGVLFRCRCECGNEKIVPRSNLLTGNTKSCGCLKLRANRLPYRGASRLREYQIWKLMRLRCENASDKAFDRYGGRGIKVCERWRNSFSDFLADMGRRPSPQHTLDRINNDGDYEPSNCRWATWGQQQNNKRSNRIIAYKGETRTLTEWAALLNMPVTTLLNRIERLGWPIERAFTRPRMRSYPRQHLPSDHH